MLQPFKFSLNLVRNIGVARGRKPYVWKDGIQYPGFKYYPRRPDFEDPPYEPSKLFQVKRIKTLKNRPYWEKNIIKELNLHEKNNSVTVVKNTPEMNSKLWKVKHLIQITPITFPNGMPNENSITQLKENGELEIKHMQAPQEQIRALEDYQTSESRMDGDTLRRELRRRWLDGWH